MIPRPPRSTLLPYTTLFRSEVITGTAATALLSRMTHSGESSLHAVRTLNQPRSEEHTSELQSRQYLVCRLLLEKKKTKHRECQSATCQPYSADGCLKHGDVE